MLSEEAIKVGFGGGLVVDYPHSTRAKKYYLCLMVGAPAATALPRALQDGGEVPIAGRDRQGGHKRRKLKDGEGSGKGKQWVYHKKEQMRGKGYVGIAPDSSKYTARKRKARF